MPGLVRRTQARGATEKNATPSKKLIETAKTLRQRSTPEERLLWKHLRRGALDGLHFRRQHPVFGFVVDFYCAQAGLIVELEGGVHRRKEQREYDRYRQTQLRARGIHILRFANASVSHRSAWVLSVIRRAAMRAPK